MELEIDNAITAEDCRLKYINKTINDRIEIIQKFYFIDHDELNDTFYSIYRKPKFELNMLGLMWFSLVKSNYFITDIIVENDMVINYVNDPSELVQNKTLLEYMFNSMDDVKIKILKNYCEWEFEDVSLTGYV